MKKTNIYKFVSGFAICLLLVGCTEDIMDKISEDKNHSTTAQANVSITDVMTSTAFSSIGSSVDLYVGIYVEHIAGVENQSYRAETRSGEPTSSTTNNNDWNSIASTIRSAKDVIKKCSPDGEEPFNPSTLGVAKILFAYNAAVYTDLFGDVPVQQIGELNESGMPKYMQPEIEKQEDIYKVVMKNLDEAEADLLKKDRDPLAGQDFLYGGDYEKWKKLIPGLKARYKMRLLARAADKNKVCEEVVVLVDSSFNSLAGQFQFAKYDGGANINPHFGIIYARSCMGASLSLVEKLIERDDPRVKNSFCDAYETLNNEFEGQIITNADTLKKYSFENGVSSMLQGGYPVFRGDFGLTTPTILLSYYELQFLKAEALVRLGRESEAIEPLNNAIRASMKVFVDNMNNSNSFLGYAPTQITAAEIDAYLTNSVLPRFTENPLKELMVQKYLAFWGANGESLEAYNDVRRLEALGEGELIGLKNPKNAQGLFPHRLPYGASDVTTNAAIKAAFGDGQYVYSEKVWWAGGSR